MIKDKIKISKSSPMEQATFWQRRKMFQISKQHNVVKLDLIGIILANLNQYSHGGFFSARISGFSTFENILGITAAIMGSPLDI